MAVMYLGASLLLTMKLPAIPPSPLHALMPAENVALFHCPTMLLAVYAFIADQLLMYPPAESYKQLSE